MSGKDRKKILIITNSYDLTTDYLITNYKDEATFFRFNIDLFSEYRISIKNAPFSFLINSPYGAISKEEVFSILYRKPILDFSREGVSELSNKSIYRTILGIIESFSGVCITKPSILSIAENKIVQMKVAEQVGFTTPASLISNDIKLVNEFRKKNKTAFKLLCSSRFKKKNVEHSIGTNILKNNDRLEGLEKMPIYFQNYQDKNYELRVNVVGENVFPAKIFSQDKEETMIDWRNNIPILRYEEAQLPKIIITKIMDMMNIMNLQFGIFDLIYFDEKYYFLEINPNGQWLWLEKELNLNISGKLINLLLRQ
jgi:glutathione synthase/RimK-type ligase-like ATP-grasp enzyme